MELEFVSTFHTLKWLKFPFQNLFCICVIPLKLVSHQQVQSSARERKTNEMERKWNKINGLMMINFSAHTFFFVLFFFGGKGGNKLVWRRNEMYSKLNQRSKEIGYIFWVIACTFTNIEWQALQILSKINTFTLALCAGKSEPKTSISLE